MAAMPDVKINVKTTLNLQAYVAYRRAEIEHEGREIAARQSGSLGGGLMVARSERLRVLEVLLAELDQLGQWLASGEPEYIPPLSEADKIHWRWVRSKGMDIPAHIEVQL
jgi:hypothetical protein